MKTINNYEAVSIIHNCAIQYDKNLSGRNVLFVTLDNGEPMCFETFFKASNFLRLTGVKTPLKSGRFYDAVLNNRLSPDEITFDHSSTAGIRLDALTRLMSIHTTARMIGDYGDFRPLLITDKFAGTVTSAMGFINVKSMYLPNTVLRKEIRDIKTQATRRKIVAIFVKPWHDAEYKTLTYIAKGLRIDDDILLPALKGRVDLQKLTAGCMP
jgi:hypothetical protein